MDDRFSSLCFNLNYLGSDFGLQTNLRGKIKLCNEVETINQSILMIIGTEPGERVMNPDFGCEINKILFSPNDDTTAGLAKYYIEKALRKWEKRIEIININLDNCKENILDIEIKYKILKSNIYNSTFYTYSLTGDN